MKKIRPLLFFTFLLLSLSILKSQTPAFPGAEGHGRYATGGRGGAVYYVNTLEDNNTGNTTTKEGSLRWCLSQKGAKTILFKVDGIIELNSQLKIENGNVTIAGQSAPGGGICVAGYPVFVQADNVILRYMRFRMGDEKVSVGEADGADALGGRFFKNIMIDHCSVSWCTDECASFYDNHEFTMQWCLVSESLRLSKHDKGPHGYGAIWGGTNASFHHNLLAHHDSRNPRLGPGQNTDPHTETVDLRNNVIYNWCGNSCYGGEAMNVNIVNCYYKPGPASPTGSKRGRIVSIDKSQNESEKRYNIWGRFYIDGNAVDDGKDDANCKKATQDNWAYGVFNQFASSYGTVSEDDKAGMKMSQQFNPGVVTTHTAEKAYEKVLAYAGASYQRDALDARIVSEVESGTAQFKGLSQYNGYSNNFPGSDVNWKSAGYPKPGIIDSQSDLKPADAGENWSAWPSLAQGTALTDSDQDGIPDGWLEQNYPGKKSTDLNSDGYTYLEVYLNNIVRNITENQNKDAIAQKNPYDADIVVAQDGSGDFTTLQAAINAVPNNSDRRTVIYIKRGVYNTEKLIIPSVKKNVTLIGESRDETIVSYHIYDCTSPESGNKCPADAYELWKDNAELIRTSATLTIMADGFNAENLTISNTAGPVGQALAITVCGDKSVFRNCNLLGYQDTIYLWTAGKRSYFENCLVVGRTDYIYGAGIAFFQACEIRSWGGGWITAPSTPQAQKYGYVFNQCKVTYADGSPRNGDDGAKFALGRPWHEYPKVAWLYCEMSEMLNPLGWPTKWNMDYADTSADLKLYEYKNTGLGADMSGRSSWVGLRAMTDEEANDYTVQKVLGGSDAWDPSAESPAVKTYFWTGSSSANQSWLNAENWNPSGVPALGDAAHVEGDYTVVADGNLFAADLNLNPSAKLSVEKDAEATYIALAGGEIQAVGNVALAGKIATKSNSAFNISGTLNLRSVISGVHELEKKGAGVLNLIGDNTNYTGTLIVVEGSLEAGGSNSLGTGSIIVGNSGKLIVSADNSFFPKSLLRIESGGKVELNKAVVLNELYINGEIQAPGSYNSTTHPSVFSGTQNIIVGRPTSFEWSPTDGKRWGNAANYKPALLPAAGDTAIVEMEMEADAVAYAATILLQKGNIRLVGNAQTTGDIYMSEGTKFNYATSGAGFSLNADVKLLGDIILQMSGNAGGNAMTFYGSFEGTSKVIAYNYTNTDDMEAKVILDGDNSLFEGTWATMASRKATSSAAFEGNAENAFGKGKIDIGEGHRVYFSHEKCTSDANELYLAQGSKAILNHNISIGSLQLAGTGYVSGTFSKTSHPDFFEGDGILTIGNLSGIEDVKSEKDLLNFDGRNLTSAEEISSIEVFNMQGICVKQQPVFGKYVSVSVDPGLYIIRAKVGNNHVHKKIFVRHIIN